MYVVLMRTLLLFIIIVLVMRLMGKRQIGQLQPAELVVTILLSEVASQPMLEPDLPVLYSVVSLILLTGFELLLSFVSLKSAKVRSILQGNSVVIIRDGVIQYEQIKRLRYTMDDILEALRQKDVFDISEVEYAVAETNGSLSVFLKPPYRTVSNQEIRCTVKDTGVPIAVVEDGELLENSILESGLDVAALNRMLKKKGIALENVLLVTVNKANEFVIYGKDGKQK